jgi:hypothetical protein
MFKHLIKIFILGMGLCCLTPAFATSCLTSARLLQNGAPVSSLSVVGGPSTLNLTLEINFDTLGAIGLPAEVTNPVGHAIGDFCSITHGVVNGVITQGTIVTNSDYLRITFGTPSITRSNFTYCRSITLGNPYNSPTATPFNFHWPDWTGYPFTNGSDYVAQVFWQLSNPINNDYSNVCGNSKLTIPLSIQVNQIASSQVLNPDMLYNIVGGHGPNATWVGSNYTKTQTPLTLTKKNVSCTVTAPSLDLGTFKPTVTRTAGILGGVLKSTTVTLNCSNTSATSVTPTVTISDANNIGNTTNCNPINAAVDGSNAFVALFRSAAIDDSPAGRYCVSTVNYFNNSIINTMTFPPIASSASAYTASVPIYAGLRYNDTTSFPNVGPVRSTLTLTVTYP